MNVNKHVLKSIMLLIFYLPRLISSFILVGGCVIGELSLIGSLVRIDNLSINININVNASPATLVGAVAVVLAGAWLTYQLVQVWHEGLEAPKAMAALFLLSLGVSLIEKLL